MHTLPPKSRTDASALLYTMVMIAVGLTILAGALSWSNTSTKQTERSNAYMASIAAAEAATESAISRISMDYLYGGESQVVANLAAYRQCALTSETSRYWGTWAFTDAA